MEGKEHFLQLISDKTETEGGKQKQYKSADVEYWCHWKKNVLDG